MAGEALALGLGDIWGYRAGRVENLGRSPDLTVPFAVLGDSSPGVKFKPQESSLRLKWGWDSIAI